ncbi:hypothetical protein BT63DRAFT_245999 [Microthyrium microscopicum]|uniref:SAGA-associated factor 11 n=1 Tax=Microthyrium microscopicum TaxID=703497 RepID=A0A6A6U9H8_9PEZI|nr:hypothetical protein BT63DRAFT_245999 [Microthyrium microscopicum]
MPADEKKKSAETTKPTITDEDLFHIAIPIFDDALFNVIQEIVSDVHISEKKLRMQSAAIQAEAVALTSAQPSTPSSANPSSATKPTAPPIATAPPAGQFNTTAATYDNGKVTLKGNPLKLQRENLCPCCKLPRLMFPIVGTGSRVPEEVNREYCKLHPFIKKPGHDIYGNPFPVDTGKTTKKEREALRKIERQEKDNTPGSADTGTADAESTAGDPGVKKLMAGGKGATYVPWQTCPSCKRSLLITKFAQHLEKCLGIGGRMSRTTAAARLSGLNGSVAGSTQGSRVGTPTPSQANGKRDAEPDSDKEDGPPKKKARKEKKEKKEKDKVTIKLFNKNGKADASKRLPKSSALNDKDKSRTDRESSQKRDRDGSGIDDAPAKKLKVKKDANSALPSITASAQ